MEWRYLQDRVESMVHQDLNHASVLIWSLGNESLAARLPLETAPGTIPRPVHYEGVSRDREFDDFRY